MLDNNYDKYSHVLRLIMIDIAIQCSILLFQICPPYFHRTRFFALPL